MIRTGCVASVVLLMAFMVANPIHGQETIVGKARSLPAAPMDKASRETPGASGGNLLGALMDLLYQLGFVDRQVAIPPKNAVPLMPEMKKAPLEGAIRGMVDDVGAPLQGQPGLQGLRQKLLDNAVKGQERLKLTLLLTKLVTK